MKTYKIKSTRVSFRGNQPDRENIIEGTLDELKQYFNYTFEVARSHGEKGINYNAKTITSFVNALQKALEFKEGCTYTRTYVELS